MRLFMSLPKIDAEIANAIGIHIQKMSDTILQSDFTIGSSCLF